MTQQNRVDPWGALHAVPSRGSLMGNRGILHDDEGKIVRKWASSTWVACVLEFRGRSSPGAFRPGHYSKLFFLDEATAFAAGHRPCGECQRARYLEFREAWKAANIAHEKPEQFSISAMDRQVHAERKSKLAANGTTSFTAPVSELPFGVLVRWRDDAWLVDAARQLRRWTFDGYEAAIEPPAASVSVLTPASIARAFAKGFRPRVHQSGL